MKRLHALDYLRGLVAVGVMCYHFLFWMYGAHSAQSFLGRLGIYGVSTFYVLSGLTLYHVYDANFTLSSMSVANFWKKRILRIFPLFWLAIVLTIWQRGQMPATEDLWLNFSGLFGLFKWDNYLVVGAWSIGNELVFYIFFPLVLVVSRSKVVIFWAIGVALLLVYLYFAFYVLNDVQSLGTQWSMYIHPLNQAFLFYGGVGISWWFKYRRISNLCCGLLTLLCVLLFIFIPSQTDVSSLISGVNRLYYTILIFVLCLCMYKLTVELPKFLHHPILILGEISFTIYLLHPLIYREIQDILYETQNQNKILGFCLSFVCHLFLSYLVYTYFEKFFVKLGEFKSRSIQKTIKL